MLPFVLGGVALAATGYGIKKWYENTQKEEELQKEARKNRPQQSIVEMHIFLNNFKDFFEDLKFQAFEKNFESQEKLELEKFPQNLQETIKVLFDLHTKIEAFRAYYAKEEDKQTHSIQGLMKFLRQENPEIKNEQEVKNEQLNKALMQALIISNDFEQIKLEYCND